MALHSYGTTAHEVIRVVLDNTDTKQRFELKDDDERGTPNALIRAVQGHSIGKLEDDSLFHRMSRADLPSITACVHETYTKHYDSIMRTGLIAGGIKGHRNHIFFPAPQPGRQPQHHRHEACLRAGGLGGHPAVHG